MRQLSGIDTGFLTMETPTTYGHVSSVLVLDPEGSEEPFRNRVRDVMQRRLHLLGPLRWRLVDVPFGIDRPYWVNDPAFDLDFHLRDVTLTPPGTGDQLAALVSRLVARPLDRTRPLWEAYVIDGLEGGLVALLTKMHHAAVDGVAGLELLTALMDIEPEPRVVEPPEREWEPERVPGEWEMLSRGYLGLLRRPERLWRAQRHAWKALVGRGGPAARPLTGGPSGAFLRLPPSPAPHTSFNRAITGQRRVAFGTLSLDEVKAVKNAHGVTVNDVILALCTGALRRWLVGHEELSDDPLLAVVPVSVRTGEEGDEGFGNRVSMMVVPLPTHEAEPHEQLRQVHESAKDAKERFGAVPADLLQDFSVLATPALMAQAARVVGTLRIADFVNPPANLVVSNVPGPDFPLYCAGSRVVAMYPVSAIGDGMGLNITVVSYLGVLHFGLVACPELVPDVPKLVGYLADALDDLKPAA